jgi:hypothetical protein
MKDRPGKIIQFQVVKWFHEYAPVSNLLFVLDADGNLMRVRLLSDGTPGHGWNQIVSGPFDTEEASDAT